MIGIYSNIRVQPLRKLYSKLTDGLSTVLRADSQQKIN